MMTYWANFAKSGDPNMGEDGRWVPSSGGSYWPVYSPTNREYLSLQAGSYLRKSALRSQECHFWSSYLPQLLRKAEEPVVSKKGGAGNVCNTAACSCPQTLPSSCQCEGGSSSLLLLSSLLAVVAFLLF